MWSFIQKFYNKYFSKKSKWLYNKGPYYLSVSYEDCQKALSNIRQPYPDVVDNNDKVVKAVKIETNGIILWTGNKGISITLSELCKKL